MGAVLGLFSAAQLACCCGSAACSLCAACPSCRNSTSTRIMYALMLLVGTVVGCIMLTPPLQDALHSVPFCKSSTGIDCKNAVGYLAVYRICFGLAIFYCLMALVMMGAKSSKDPRAGIQNGFWGIKYLLVIGFIVGAFFIPETGSFGTTWMYFGLFGGLAFIVVQLVLIIDFAHTWAENWMDRYERTESKWWFAAMMIITFVNYALVITGVTLLFINYTTADSCGWEKFIISIVLIMSVIISVVSILPAVQERQTRSGLLQSSVVSLYVVYLTWSALSSSPDEQCNAGGMLAIIGERKGKVGFDKQAVIALCIWVCCVIYSSFSSASKSSRINMSEHVLVKDSGDAESSQGDKKVWDNEEDGVAYEWSFFHLTFCLSTLYIMMTLTNWYSPNSSLDTLNSNSASMWVKVVSSWMCLGLYLWTLVAPILLPNRVFDASLTRVHDLRDNGVVEREVATKQSRELLGEEALCRCRHFNTHRKMFPLPLSEVNELPDEAFINFFGNVIEHAPSFAEQLCDARPFESVENMIEFLTDILTGLNDRDREVVLNRYPDLADSSRFAELSSESSREHKSAGLTTLGNDQSATISEQRARYRAKFGFPFVVCARESTPESVVSGIQHRLQRSRKEELEEGIKQVSHIAALRIADLVADY